MGRRQSPVGRRNSGGYASFWRERTIIVHPVFEARNRSPRSRALATINGLAVFANACAAAFCVVALALIWRGLRHGEIWCIRLLVACAVPLQGLGFACDIYFRHKDLLTNVVSSVILLLGLFAARMSVTRNGTELAKEETAKSPRSLQSTSLHIHGKTPSG